MKKNIIKIYKIMIGFSSLLSALGCPTDGIKENPMDLLRKIGIGGAKALYIAPVGGQNVMFKITADGQTQEVTYADENANPIFPTLSPVSVCDANSQYVVILFGYVMSRDYYGFIVDKSTETAYDMGDLLPVPQINNFKNAKMISCDGSNNMYFRYFPESASVGPCLRKMNVSDPANLSSTLYSRDSEGVCCFSADPAGNLIYQGFPLSDPSTPEYRIKKADGSTYDLLMNYPNFWTGPDGTLYCTDIGVISVKKVEIDGAFNVIISDYGGIPGSNVDMQRDYLLTAGSRLAILNAASKLYEVYNTSNTPREVPLDAAFTEVVAADSSASAYFIAGIVSDESSLIKVDPDTGVSTALVASGTYSFYTIAVVDDGVVIFNAIRNSDGKKIIGEVDASGPGPYTVDIIDDAMNAEVLVLERMQ